MNRGRPQDPEQARRERLLLQRAARLRNALRQLLESPSGRVVLGWLFEEGRVLETTFTGGSDSFWHEGRRSLAVDLFKHVKAISPAKLVMLWQELDAAEEASQKQDMEAEQARAAEAADARRRAPPPVRPAPRPPREA